MHIARQLSPTATRATDEEVSPDEQSLLQFLRSGRVVSVARGLLPDELDPDRHRRVPISFLTDGDWIWSGASVYYAERYGQPVDPELREHAAGRNYAVGDVSDEAVARALDALRDSGQ